MKSTNKQSLTGKHIMTTSSERRGESLSAETRSQKFRPDSSNTYK